MLVFAIVSIAAAAIGAALLFVGMRGRRLDDHPVCRQCRFDLIGLPERSACPECGADLSRPRALRSGNRAGRPFHLLAALVLLAVGGAGAWPWGRQVHWITMVPESWLVWRATLTPTRVPQVVTSELLQRILSPEGLGLASVERLAAAAQASAGAPRTPPGNPLAMLVQEAVILGQAPASVWQGMARAGSRFDQLVESPTPATDRWPIELHILQDGLAGGAYPHVGFVSASVDGEPLPGPLPIELGGSLMGPGGAFRGVFSRRYVQMRLPPGEHTLRVTYRVVSRLTDPRLPSPIEVEWNPELQTTFEVAQPGSIESVVRPQPLDGPMPAPFLLEPQLWVTAEGVRGAVTVVGPPRDLAFTVLFRQNGVEARVGSMTAAVADPDGVRNFGLTGSRVPDGPGELVFRSDAMVSQEAFGQPRVIWAGEVVFFGVDPRPGP